MTPPCLPSDATTSTRTVKYIADSASLHESDPEEEVGERPVVSDPSSKGNDPGDEIANDSNASLDESVQQQQQQQQAVECNKCLSDSGDECDRPSNAKLLGIAFVTFLSFAVVQMVFALIAGSQAMVGDSTAMIVDSVTYFLNWLAERRKNILQKDEAALLQLCQQRLQAATASPSSPTASNNTVLCMAEQRRILERTKRKEVLKLEIVPPIVSVIPLVVVTIMVLQTAIKTLHDSLTHKSASATANSVAATPNVNIMLAFGLTNLFLDFLNVFCFARAKHMCGFHTHSKESWRRNRNNNTDTNTNNNAQDPTLQLEQGERDVEDMEVNSSSGSASSRRTSGPTLIDLERQQQQPQQREGLQRRLQRWRLGRQRQNTSSTGNDGEDDLMTHLCPNDCQDDDNNTNTRGHAAHDDDDDHANLNMCSACTHVFADTLRSLAMILAVLVNKLFPDTFSPEEADSSAALLVSVLIAASLVPLFRGLYRSCSALIEIQKQERYEQQQLQQHQQQQQQQQELQLQQQELQQQG